MCTEGRTGKSTPGGHTLAPGVQVRSEKAGLLFYSLKGPRLYFLSSGPWLEPDYFHSGADLVDWLDGSGRPPCPGPVLEALQKALAKLAAKGVLCADPYRP
ncbi:MAG: mycofactocin biosynthesis chaperone MftB [Thermodesulfobacteriota bacterium]